MGIDQSHKEDTQLLKSGQQFDCALPSSESKNEHMIRPKTELSRRRQDYARLS